MRRKRTSSKLKQKQLPLFSLFQEKEEEVKSLLSFYVDLKEYVEELRGREDVWKFLKMCPPDSPLEAAVRITYESTDIPPSISFFSMLVILGAKFTQMGFVLKLNSQEIRPNLWVLTLASSGSGKTFSLKNVCLKIIDNGSIEMLPEISTAAAMVQLMNERPEKARGLLVRDEIAQLFRMLRKDTYVDLKDFFLRSYDGGPIERRTKKEGTVVVKDTYISIYGTTVLDTFVRNLTEEDFLDGFMQRFLIHIPKREKEVGDRIVSLYMIKEDVIDRVRRKTDEILDQLSDAPRVFQPTDAAIQVFDRWFKEHFNRRLESYYRRYMFASLKVALIYKLLNYHEEQNTNITKQDMAHAIQVIVHNLDSLYLLMNDYMEDYITLINKVETYIRNHPKCTKREIIQNVRGIQNVRQLNDILSIIEYTRRK